MRTGYKLLRQFNHEVPFNVGSRNPFGEHFQRHFPGEGMPDRFARALARGRAVPVKEVFESFEFFGRVRKRVRAPVVADLCAGHGLTGVLFALFERSVERVVCLDQRRTESFETVLEAAISVGPWVRDRVVYETAKLGDAAEVLDPGTSIVGVHACGTHTDTCLDVAVALGSNAAVMPCCYPHRRCRAPATIVQHFGGDVAFDIDRTYRMEREGYRVRWDGIPTAITPMARILIATRAEVRTEA
jgi:hypothetical protein